MTEAPVDKKCAMCGISFIARSSRAIYCGTRCKERAAEGRRRKAAPIGDSDPYHVQIDLVGSVRDTLAVFGEVDSWRGQNALGLAQRLTRSENEPGAVIAALSRELRAVMAEVESVSAGEVADPLNEILARRDGS